MVSINREFDARMIGVNPQPLQARPFDGNEPHHHRRHHRMHIPIQIDDEDEGGYDDVDDIEGMDELEEELVNSGRSQGHTSVALQRRMSELTLSFEGEVYVFRAVSAEKVQAVLLLLGGREVPSGVPTADVPFHSNNRGMTEAPRRSNLSRRVASLVRFREKRKERCFEKKIRYNCRKEVALRQHRKKGQFVSVKESYKQGLLGASSWDPSHSGLNDSTPRREPVLRKCQHCGISENSTPAMRRGPAGPRSLCNACGLMWANKGTLRDLSKSGRHHSSSQNDQETKALAMETENSSAEPDEQENPNKVTLKTDNQSINPGGQGPQGHSEDMKPSPLETGHSSFGLDEQVIPEDLSKPFPMGNGNFSANHRGQGSLYDITNVSTAKIEDFADSDEPSLVSEYDFFGHRCVIGDVNNACSTPTMKNSCRYLPMNVLEQCRVSPPSGSVPETSLPLNFFDLIWLGLHPVHRLVFYKVNCSKLHFMDTILPNIKNSLSLTLEHFFPLAGNLIWSPQSYKPEILYVDGDSISLTIAESDFDFDHLSSNHSRDVNKLHTLIPLPLSSVSTTRVPLFALQVTLFPDSGISIGMFISHVVGDGRTSTQFMKSWASVSKFGGITSSMLESPPLYDRSTIKDPYGLETIFLNGFQNFGISRECLCLPNPPEVQSEKVLATFVMGQSEIEKLKKWVSARNLKGNIYSTFAVTCACVWVCLIKALGEDNAREHFLFAVDCRARLEPALPITYFGNCVMALLNSGTKSDLVGEDGIAVAAEVIRNGIQGAKDDRLFEKAANFFTDIKSVGSERVRTVAGSPNLKAYNTDFGWGKPKKVEVVSISDTGAISLAERSDGEVGVEVGLALKESEMDAFVSIFVDTIKSVP
ncbi:hypothetical protein GIB67_019576 [Kingdonia uniflora]|uniref:Uncharacterized protein n=1 Tax=Kingdonia uniflora TaxID=39325 RepID=A0A7J7N0H7_9MAGN|nr:hypothetical protein GIB67_019576 [Kingdonia uniflora]